MIRSNSSGGFQHHHQPNSPRATRGRAGQPSLADLEFPPPPPPEELQEQPTYRYGFPDIRILCFFINLECFIDVMNMH